MASAAQDGDAMGTRIHPVAGWSLEDTNYLLHIFERIRKKGISVEFNDLKDFCEWARASGWQYGMRLICRNKNGPFSPDNCEWEQVTQRSDVIKRELELAQQWNNFVTPIRERYAEELKAIAEKQNARNKKLYFRYEHPDLVREGIVWTT